jgi:hypothetical protein
VEAISDLSDEVWPEYNQHGEALNYYWAQLYDVFPKWQFVLYHPGGQTVLAEGHTTPSPGTAPTPARALTGGGRTSPGFDRFWRSLADHRGRSAAAPTGEDPEGHHGGGAQRCDEQGGPEPAVRQLQGVEAAHPRQREQQHEAGQHGAD